MASYDALLDLDGNGRPIYGDSPFKVSKDLTTNAATTTVNPAIFTVTGSVMLTRLWGVVTTDLGANHTAASWRINDQTAQVYLTAVGGTTLSALKAGSIILKKDLVAAALSKIDNVAGAISEPTTLETMAFSPIIITKKTGAVTQIEYKYTTSTNPTTGAIRFYACYYPLTDGGALDPA